MRRKTSRAAVQRLEPRVLFTTYFVAQGGSDGAAGTSAQAPFATLQHAADLVQAGDTVDVLPGTYAAGFVIGWDSPQNGTASAPITFHAESGVTITGRNNKTADAIDLEGASYVVVDGFNITNPAGTITRAGIRSVTNNHVTIENNHIDGMGTWGIFTAFSDDVLIRNNVASHSQSQHGIYVSNSSQRPVVRGNTLFGNYSCGLHMNGDVSQGGVGIISGALVEDNVVYDNGAGGGGSGINCDGVQNSRFQNNLIFDEHSSGLSLYRTDAAAPSSGNVVVNNTIIVASDGRWALNIHDASTGNLAYNNILLNENPNHGSIDITADSLTGFRSDYNAVVDHFTPDDNNFQTLIQWQSGTGNDAHSFLATPDQLFVNASGNDYRLVAGSPAIDAGTSMAAPNQPPVADLTGGARPIGSAFDIGADEFGSSGTPPPVVRPDVPPLVADQQRIDAEKALIVSDTAASRTALAADRGAMAHTRAADLLAIAADRRAMAQHHADPASLAADKQKLAADVHALVADLARLRAALVADIAHWKQTLAGDRIAPRLAIRQLALDRRGSHA